MHLTVLMLHLLQRAMELRSRVYNMTKEGQRAVHFAAEHRLEGVRHILALVSYLDCALVPAYQTVCWLMLLASRQTEEQHLAYFDRLLPKQYHSILLPLWRGAGFSLGFLPSMIGPSALFLTVQVQPRCMEHV